MRIPQMSNFGLFGVQKIQKSSSKTIQKLPPFELNKSDSISFSASTAQYLKKYNTLPDEIKEVLNPKDAIDMFKFFEDVHNGVRKGVIIGQGENSRVYENPWLKDCDFIIVKDANKKTQTIYSAYILGDAIWSDVKAPEIQITKRIA